MIAVETVWIFDFASTGINNVESVDILFWEFHGIDFGYVFEDKFL